MYFYDVYKNSYTTEYAIAEKKSLQLNADG